MELAVFKTLAWQCPSCHGNLTIEASCLLCNQCHSRFRYHNNQVFFGVPDAKDYDHQDNRLRDFFKRWPGIYHAIAVILGPMFFSGLSAQKFLRRYHVEGVTLNAGSGPRVLGPDVVNVDLTPYPGVTIVSDIAKLPLKTGSVGRVICDNVIEHVADPRGVANELYRVLRTGGYAYFCQPFLYPFHASPADYTRWTQAGFIKMLDGFEVVEAGVRAGAFSALTVHLCYMTASALSFGNKNLYWWLVHFSMLVFFPIKLLDAVFWKMPYASHTASVLYFVAKKK